MEFLLYLGGPITGTAYGECTDWRNDVIDDLPPWIVGVSPMRNKRYLASETRIADAYEERALSSARGITTRDRFDVGRCDAALFNLLGVEKVSIGSVLEIAWADGKRIPIIVVMEDGNPHDHAMVRQCCGYIVPTLDEAVKVATAVLLPWEVKS